MFVLEGDEVVAVNGTFCEGTKVWDVLGFLRFRKHGFCMTVFVRVLPCDSRSPLLNVAVGTARKSTHGRRPQPKNLKHGCS